MDYLNFALGGVAAPLLIMLVVTVFTQFKPLTEKQIQVLKGGLAVLFFAVYTFIQANPQYQGVVNFAILSFMAFVMAGGYYDLIEKRIPQIKSKKKEPDE